MGTHPSNPSKDISTGLSLLDMVSSNQSLLSPAVAARYNSALPFLFKILSIRKALSIQAHPDKKLAERLREQDPKNYPDDNHKPEMTIAVTAFDGFCGFRPLAEIKSFLSHIPTFRQLVGEETAAEFEEAVKEPTSEESKTVEANKAALKKLFSALMHAEQTAIESAAKDLIAAATDSPGSFGGSEHGGEQLAKLIQRLNSQFPNDIGLFCTFLLNYITLQPGEAIFLQANDPHAYLSGDIIECMAASDNVVRAGFTPKFKDVKNLTEMLTYSYAPIEAQKMKPVAYSKGSNSKADKPTSLLYDPPIDEFAVVRTGLGEGQKETFEGVQGPSIVIFTEGGGKITVGPKTLEAREGLVFFVGATAEVVIEAAEKGTVAFRAFCEIEE